MKRSFLVLLLLPVFCLAVVAPAAGAEAPATLSPAISPSCPAPEASGAASVPGAPPEPIWLNHCNAQQSCPSGVPVSCEGHSSCIVGSDWVSCDGVVHECTQCGEAPNCIDPAGYCSCRAGGGGPLFCHGTYCLNCWPLHPECAGG